MPPNRIPCGPAPEDCNICLRCANISKISGVKTRGCILWLMKDGFEYPIG